MRLRTGISERQTTVKVTREHDNSHLPNLLQSAGILTVTVESEVPIYY
ncbi:hypothetical protein [Phytoactinopolyspora endophytica]|nr:hypothetical protein [Phytoactinopolyspora endophytica]